jgi:hypothetical protein
MQTQEKTKTFSINGSSSINDKLMELPILKNFNQNEISTKIDSFRKGEKGLFWFFKLAVLVGVGYLTWTYVLPPVFQAIGQFLAVAATGILILLAVFMAPLIIRGIRAFTRFIHKLAMNYNPFAQLAIEGQKMVANQQSVIRSKGKIVQLKNDMELEAKNAEKEAEEGQKSILRLQAKAEKFKLALDAMVKEKGPAIKGEDEYVNTSAELTKILSEANRVANKMNQSKDFVQKYGVRANVMKKMAQKLTMVETSMEIKISDFNATIEMLKKDYQFGEKSREATTAAKSALGFTKGWELEYALEVVTNTIAEDIAITSGNLRDIDSLTSGQYSLDSDELYENLNTLADGIRIGKDIIPDAKQYSNPEYQLSSEDKVKSGGFGDLM